MTEQMICVGIAAAVAILLLILGYLVWKKEKITLFHDYHVDNVSPENKKAFCTLSGIGLFLMGLSLLITAGILAVTDSALSFLIFAVGFIVGLIMLITAERKYNHGT